MVILSFTIKDMRDDVEHLESLGKAQTAVVRLWGQHQQKQKEPEKKQKKHTKEVVLIPRNNMTPNYSVNKTQGKLCRSL